MVDLKRLNDFIKDTGMTYTFIASKAGMSRQTLYHRLAGKGEFTLAEVSNLTKVLGLTTKLRNEIFFK